MTVQAAPAPRVLFPLTLPEAVSALAMPGACAIAGATWLARSPARQEDLPETVVSLGRIPALFTCDIGPDEAVLGPMLTHEALAEALPEFGPLAGLRKAAVNSANPGVRRLATLGGNLCTRGFPASDLQPALIALDAQIDTASADGPSTEPVAQFLARSGPLPLVTAIRIPTGGRRSTHRRLTLRAAGEYPVVSVCVSRTDGGHRIAVGALADRPFRWAAAEQLADQAHAAGALPEVAALAEATGALTARDAADVAGWYRLQVLPALTHAALGELDTETRG